MNRNQLIAKFEKYSLDRAIDAATQLNDIWGFCLYDLILSEGFNAIYQLKKHGKVFADLKLDGPPETVDYLLKCAWAAGADLVSIKANSHQFENGVVAYPTCYAEHYEYYTTVDGGYLLSNKAKESLACLSAQNLMLC
ncbi:hypothetical protein C4588_05685 [Candidatus Parcubacteria bacterium]|nr:MAG: hypothetical protein C4588_05685 [Candidatus Parcubacteria bacterium]